MREGWHHKQNIENDEISIIYPNFDVLVGQLLQSVWQGDYREQDIGLGKFVLGCVGMDFGG